MWGQHRAYVLGVAPPAVPYSIFLRNFFAFLPYIDHKTNDTGNGDTHTQVCGVQAGSEALKRSGKAVHQMQKTLRKICTGGKSKRHACGAFVANAINT